MSETYSIIKDKAALQAYIDWLPALSENTRYYGCLFARKKYLKESVQSSDKASLKRFVATKERLVQKIEQLEIRMGNYRLKSGPAPQECLALYINPNPRDLEKAAYASIIELTRLLQNKAKGFNPHQEVMSCIQQSSIKKKYLDFDVDTLDFDFSELKQYINPSALNVLRTRGGYHILVEVEKVEEAYRNTFYQNIVGMGVDQVGDQLMPVPGCVQGGFVPHFIHPFD